MFKDKNIKEIEVFYKKNKDDILNDPYKSKIYLKHIIQLYSERVYFIGEDKINDKMRHSFKETSVMKMFIEDVLYGGYYEFIYTAFKIIPLHVKIYVIDYFNNDLKNLLYLCKITGIFESDNINLQKYIIEFMYKSYRNKHIFNLMNFYFSELCFNEIHYIFIFKSLKKPLLNEKLKVLESIFNNYKGTKINVIYNHLYEIFDIQNRKNIVDYLNKVYNYINSNPMNDQVRNMFKNMINVFNTKNSKDNKFNKEVKK